VLQSSDDPVLTNWATLDRFAPGARADGYEVKLSAGADAAAYVVAARAGDSGLRAEVARGKDSAAIAISSTVALLTVLLGAVAALGVFNTVVLNTRERRRELGTLKSIGMTPRQVVLMMVTSMTALGAVGGLIGIPLGIVFQRYAMHAMTEAARIVIPDRMINAYPVRIVAALFLAGALIAAVGAFLPARSAARLTIAEALHTE
jgi:putative ABC transport system permease protein